MRSKHIVRHHHVSFPLSLSQKLYTLLWGPLLTIAVVAGLFYLAGSRFEGPIPLSTIALAGNATLVRLAIAYFLALIFSIPLALLAVSSRLMERIFLPTFDILESVPVFAFFPIIVVAFLKYGLADSAAVFILFISMVWSIVFTVIGGLKIIPEDIKDAAKIFGLSRMEYFRSIILPAIVPEIVTGSIIAVGAGWNIIIVAEALHAYLPTSGASDLFGIGSILVESAGSSPATFFAALVMLVAMIAFINLFIWQNLLRYAERFRFD